VLQLVVSRRLDLSHSIAHTFSLLEADVALKTLHEKLKTLHEKIGDP
jgi:hypothetical protein